MPGRSARFDWEDFFGWRSIEMGRPLLGMRVNDLLAVIEQQRGYKGIYVIGLGPGGVVALHAAALSDAIAGVASIQSIASYQDILEHPARSTPVTSFAPGALLSYDLPELMERIRPRRTVVSAERLDARRILEGLRLS